MATDIFVGSVAVGVVPDARGWDASLQRQLVPSAEKIGTEYGKTMGRKISDSMGKAGEQSGGAFGDTFRKRLDAALKALPKAQLDGDSSKIDRKLEELRLKMEEIAKTDMMDPEKALKDLAVIQVELDRISSKSKDIRVTFNTKEARAQLAMLQRDVGSTARGGGILSRIPGAGILSNLPGLGGVFGGGATAASQAAGAAGPAASAGGSLLTNPYVLGIGGGAAALAAPFAGQAVGGLGVAGLGAGLAAIGAAGAFGLGTTAPVGKAQLVAQQNALASATARAALSQAALVKLQNSGKASASQLAAAHASLATAQANVTTQQSKLTDMQKQNIDQTTKGQLKVRQAFEDLKTNAIADLTKIGVAFVPVLENIAGTAQRVLGKMTPVFAGAMKIIAGPVQNFVDTVLNAFSRPAVIKSIQDIAKAFGAILTAFTPDIPGIADSLAQAISRIAEAVAKNPKAFADFLNFLFQIVIFVIDAIAWLTIFANYLEAHFVPAVKRAWHDVQSATENIWNSIWNNIIGRAIRGGHDLEVVYNHIKQNIINWWHDVQNWTASTWNTIWNNTVGRIIRGWHDVINIYNRLRSDIINWWHNVQNTTASIWNTIWSNTVGRAINGANSLMNVFTRLKTNIVNWFHDAVNWLVSAGSNVVTGLLNGIKNGMKSIGSWIKSNVVDPVVNSVKSFFGIHSPASIMVPIGANIIAGLMKGIFSGGKDLTHFIKNVFGGMPAALGSLVQKGLVDLAKLPAKALSAISSLGGKIGGFFAKLFGGGVGGGVQRWAGVVAQALAMLGLPLSLGKQVLYQMQTESGGNPNAINLTDINAQHGDPSRGLLQTIMSTFMAYHVPGTSGNIYDPLANVAAAINYARHVYGPTLMRGGMGMGSGHGYDKGGWWPPNTIGWNTSGKHELVVTQEQLRAGALAGGSTGPEYHAHFDGLTGQAIESHVQTAFVSMSLTQGHLNRQGRRS